MESWQVLKSALAKVGVKKVASRMGLSQSLVYRWAQPGESATSGPSGSGVANPLDRLARLVELTGDRELVQWLCRQAGGFYVSNPVASDPTNLAVLRQTQEMIQDFSGLLEAVSVALANDQVIDPPEAARIRDAWEKLKQVGETFAVSCEHGCYGRKP